MIRSGAVEFHPDLEPLMYPIDSAHPHPENYNEGDLEAIDHSVEANGMYGPVVVQKSTGHIVKGNHTWQTVKARGAEVCPMIWVDVDDATARRIMVDDNHTAALAMPNPAALVELLEKIKEADGDLSKSSYREFDLEILQHLAEIPLEYDEYAQWPTFSVQVHPRILKAFRHFTREADNDKDRFEVLLRLAGWDGN